MGEVEVLLSVAGESAAVCIGSASCAGRRAAAMLL